MPDTCFFRNLPDGEVEWLVLDDSTLEVRVRGRGEVATLSERLDGISWSGDTCLLLPSEQTLLTRVRVPSKQARQIAQAVPYLVEEQLASDVEDMVFATGAREGETLLVAAISRSSFETGLDAFQDWNLRRASVEVLLLPTAEATTVLIDGGRAHIRQPDGTGLTVQTALLPSTLSLMSPSAISVTVAAEDKDAADLVIASLGGDDVTVEVSVTELSAFEYLCRLWQHSSFNLLQGEYEPEEVDRGGDGAGWQAAAILAGCAFLLHLILTFGQGLYLGMRADAYDLEARALYAEIFPRDRNVRDIRRRWRAHLGSGGDEAGAFLVTFRQVAENLPGSNLTLQNVNFNESRGDLILQLQAARSEQLVLFAESLGKAGLDAEIGTIAQEDNGVRGSVKIRSGG